MADALITLVGGRRGHFRTESGYHSDRWLDLDRLFESPRKLRPFVAELAARLSHDRIDAICGPMTGGAKLAKLVAAELGSAYVFTERFESIHATGLFPVRYELPSKFHATVRGKSIAIVDDAISAGSAIRGTHADLLRHEARPVSLGALFVFGTAADDFARDNQLRLEAIHRESSGLWKPEACPHCRRGTALEIMTNEVPKRPLSR